MAKYIPVAETAKLIRQALKENFKGIKFSVRSRSYAGGASVDISWTDGPCDPVVERIVKQFQGASFDGMTDSKSYFTSELNGEEVHFGADYVFCKRHMSYEFIETIAAQFCKRYGLATDTIKVTGNAPYIYADTRKLDYSQEHWFNDLLRNTDVKDMHRAYAAEDERETSQRAEYEAYAKAQAERQAKAQAEAKAKAEQERKEREQAEFAMWQQEQLHNEDWQREQFKKWQVERAQMARETAERARQAAEQARRERERREQEERARRQREQQERDRANAQKRSTLTTKASALAFFGLTSSASREDVLKAFRSKVKAAADGNGGYAGDMDLLVKAKKMALK